MSGQQSASTSGKTGTHSGALAALLLFAVVCGLVLVLLGSGASGPAERARDLRLTPRLQKLSQQVQQAERALFTANYGQCRETLRAANQDLSRLLSQLHAVEEDK